MQHVVAMTSLNLMMTNHSIKCTFCNREYFGGIEELKELNEDVIEEVTDKKIASIQKKINSRPRKKLKFETPKAEFFKRIA